MTDPWKFFLFDFFGSGRTNAARRWRRGALGRFVVLAVSILTWMSLGASAAEPFERKWDVLMGNGGMFVLTLTQAATELTGTLANRNSNTVYATVQGKVMEDTTTAEILIAAGENQTVCFVSVKSPPVFEGICKSQKGNSQNVEMVFPIMGSYQYAAAPPRLDQREPKSTDSVMPPLQQDTPFPPDEKDWIEENKP